MKRTPEQIRDAVLQRRERRERVEDPPPIEWIRTYLRGFEMGFENVGGVIELREGFRTDFGRQYTAFLTDTANTFEQILFRVYCQPDAKQKVRLDLYEDEVREVEGEERIQDALDTFMNRPQIFDQIEGLLDQALRIRKRRRSA